VGGNSRISENKRGTRSPAVLSACLLSIEQARLFRSVLCFFAYRAYFLPRSYFDWYMPPFLGALMIIVAVACRFVEHPATRPKDDGPTRHEGLSTRCRSSQGDGSGIERRFRDAHALQLPVERNVS